jgi:class 3 adenylate cyclase
MHHVLGNSINLKNIQNTVFTEFDHICRYYHIEKIQTIGDSYIAARLTQTSDATSTPNIDANKKCPAPFSFSSVEVSTAAYYTCLVGLYMQRVMLVFQSEGLFEPFPDKVMRIRVGIHSGPSFGTLTGGKTKIKYELIGEAIEIAEEVQSRADPGSVWVSDKTKGLVSEALKMEETAVDEENKFEMVRVEAQGADENQQEKDALVCYVLKRI